MIEGCKVWKLVEDRRVKVFESFDDAGDFELIADGWK